MKGASYNQLLIFHAIVREGSISGAARKLEIAPPSVSQSLKSLETQLGLPLFTRTTRRVEPTEAGQLLYDKTVGIVADLSSAFESVSDLSERPSGRVSITMPRFAYQSLIQPIYDEFCARYPQIELEFSISDGTVDIIKEGIDLGIRFGDKVEEGMVARQLTPKLREALFASPAYIQKHGIPKSIEELKQHKLIQYRFITSNQLAPLILSKDDSTVHVDVMTSLVVNDTDIMVDAAMKGLGIGRIVTPLVESYFSNGQLIPVLEKHWYNTAGLYLYFHRNTQKARRVRVLIDFLYEKLLHGSDS
ncbi:LysR family transcriptional regulator [Photobacterium jeanii]|uniref:LysR family transcriptional regulator n=1 Tax=Photobacterium jeanii TaxID=858640 RepID=A0A178KMT6_9GAMM|nr:LysR family transcriptional regulator [Photobacterium jeanii]OAN17872.1 LysR family transcriptional regulator [Photobacterium jeanii]PST92460.1 LysR family transcriptional regulator [Photobacterium jeanii]